MRGYGTRVRARQIAPVRSITSSGVSAVALRFTENQRSGRARGGDGTKPPSSPEPVRPRSIIGMESSVTPAGSSRRSTVRTSSALPTGRIVVWAWPPAPCADEREARFTAICHQPNGRHSSGWLTLTE